MKLQLYLFNLPINKEKLPTGTKGSFSSTQYFQDNRSCNNSIRPSKPAGALWILFLYLNQEKEKENGSIVCVIITTILKLLRSDKKWLMFESLMMQLV